MSLVSTLRRLRSGLSFGGGADGGVNSGRVGWLSDSRRPGSLCCEPGLGVGRGFPCGGDPAGEGKNSDLSSQTMSDYFTPILKRVSRTSSQGQGRSSDLICIKTNSFAG